MKDTKKPEEPKSSNATESLNETVTGTEESKESPNKEEDSDPESTK